MLKQSALAACMLAVGSFSTASAQSLSGPALSPARVPAASGVTAAPTPGRDTALMSPAEALTISSTAAEDDLYAKLAAEASILQRVENVVKLVAQAVRPAVVHVEASKVEQTRGRRESFDEAGSGVIIRRDGGLWVLTNRHVVRGAEPNEITLRLWDGRTLHPVQVVSDPGTDVAVLRLPEVDVPVARVGVSGQVTVGDFVLAVGSPFGLSHSVTFGIISATGRRDLTLGTERIELQDFFQTDAAINPGNSGGPLLNLRGEVIGINTAIASSSGGSEGIGFAIPIDMVNRVADQLIEYGQVRRAYLGVSLSPDFVAGEALRLGLPAPGGALVKTVRDDSPAVIAGIRVGDVIAEFDGVPIENDDHLVTRVGLTPIGREIPLVVYRGGRAYRTKVTLTVLD